MALQRLMQLLRLHRLVRFPIHRVGRGQDCIIRLGHRFRHRQLAFQVLRDHRERTLREIAEIVGEIRIRPVHDRIMTVVAVLPERHLAQEEVAKLINSVGVGKLERIDDIADRLRHFLPAIEQKAVAVHALRRRNPRRHQERRPVDRMKTHDIFSDDVQIRRPEFLERGRIHVRIADAGDVVREGIDPHIHHVLQRARYRHAPVERGA